MLIAYLYRLGTERQPELCLIPSKPDQYSVPVNIFNLPITDNAVVRIGPSEAVLMYADSKDSGRIIAPVKPAKLLITPSQPDRAGEVVERVKVMVRSETRFEIYYQREADLERNEWKLWNPNSAEKT